MCQTGARCRPPEPLGAMSLPEPSTSISQPLISAAKRRQLVSVQRTEVRQDALAAKASQHAAWHQLKRSLLSNLAEGKRRRLQFIAINAIHPSMCAMSAVASWDVQIADQLFPLRSDVRSTLNAVAFVPAARLSRCSGCWPVVCHVGRIGPAMGKILCPGDCV